MHLSAQQHTVFHTCYQDTGNKDIVSLLQRNPDISRQYQSKHSFIMMNTHRGVCLHASHGMHICSEYGGGRSAYSEMLFCFSQIVSMPVSANLISTFKIRKCLFFSDVLGRDIPSKSWFSYTNSVVPYVPLATTNLITNVLYYTLLEQFALI